MIRSEGSLQSALNTASIWDGVSKFRNQRNREPETGAVEREGQLEKKGERFGQQGPEKKGDGGIPKLSR